MRRVLTILFTLGVCVAAVLFAGASAAPGQRLYWCSRIGPPRFSAKERWPRPIAPSASKPPPVVEKSSAQPRKSVV